MIAKNFFARTNMLKTESKGVTLIELVIVLALMGIVTAAIFSFYSFSVDTFNTAKNKSDIQQDILIAANFITNELRTATDVYISYGEVPINDNGIGYAYIKLKNNQLVHGYGDTVSRTIVKTNIKDIHYVLDPETNIMKFYIIGVEGGQLYSIESEVSLLNLGEPNTNGLLGSCVYYQKPS